MRKFTTQPGQPAPPSLRSMSPDLCQASLRPREPHTLDSRKDFCCVLKVQCNHSHRDASVYMPRFAVTLWVLTAWLTPRGRLFVFRKCP